jgi:hypothetical protein
MSFSEFTTYQITLVTIVAIIVVVTLVVIVASYSKPGSFIDRLTSKIPTISTFIIALGIIITYQIFTVNYLSVKRDSTYKIVDRAFNSILKAFDDYYDKAPEFIDSMFYPWQKRQLPNYKPVNEKKNEDNDRWTSILYISTLIFQSWEDFLTDLESWREVQFKVEYIEDDERSWLAIFLGWAQSKELQEVFPMVELQYGEGTIELAYLMFEYSNKYPVKNMEELQDLTGKIFNDPRYIKIKEVLNYL